VTDIPFTGTGGLSDTQSYSWIIVNAIYDRLVGLSLFEGFTIRRINRALPIEAGTHIPFLGVYQSAEKLSADGEPNMGDIRFKHDVDLGFQIVVKDNDAVRCLQTLDRCSWFLMNQLLRDNTLTNRLNTNMPDNVRFEGIPRGNIRERWGLSGQKNETPVGERLLELTFAFRTMWAPTDFPDLGRIAVQTGFPIDGTADDRAKVQQVTMVYDFTPDAVPNPLPAGTPSPFPFPPFIPSP
jgi:hypothetical protein